MHLEIPKNLAMHLRLFNRLVASDLYVLQPDYLAIKWAHPITSEHDCLTEWGAVEKARNISFSIDTSNGMHTLSNKSFLTSSSTSNRRVRFTDDVDVRLGDDDDFTPLQVTIPGRALAVVSLLRVAPQQLSMICSDMPNRLMMIRCL